MSLCGQEENCVTCVSATSSVFKVRAFFRSSSRENPRRQSIRRLLHSRCNCGLFALPTVVALHRERRRLPRGTRSDRVTRGANLSCDSLVSFRPATRLPIFFSANEHPIACSPLLSHATDSRLPRSTSGLPELRRAAMFELNDEPELVESPRPRVWAQ